MPNPKSYFRGTMRQFTAPYSGVDTTLPTFGGIQAATPNADGTFTVTWNFGSTTKNPLRYEVYIALGVVPAITLFAGDFNIVKIVADHINSTIISTLADNSTYIVNGQQYTIGVRAIDAFGFESNNTQVITATAIGSGNLAGIFQTLATNIAATEALLAQDHLNFQDDHANFQRDRNPQSDILGTLESLDQVVGVVEEQE